MGRFFEVVGECSAEWGGGGGELLPDHFYIIDNLLDGDRGREETSDLFFIFYT